MHPALYKAATQGDVATLRRLLVDSGGGVLNSMTPQRNTAAHIAAAHGHTDFAGAAVDERPELLVATNADGDTALHLAAREGRLGVAELLIRKAAEASPPRVGGGPDVEATTPESPLVTANDAGNTPLHEAARRGWSAVALKLLEAGPGGAQKINGRMETPLHIAAREGLVDVVHRILSGDQGPEVIKSGSGSVSGTALHQAVLGKHINIMEILLEKDPGLIGLTDSNGNNALHYAAQKNHKRGVAVLLARRTELAYSGNSEHRSSLHVAVHHGSTDAMKALLRHCPDLAEMADGAGRNAFHAAAAAGRTSAVRWLLRHAGTKELITRGDRNGNTPLHLAARSSRVYTALQLLRDHRVDPCATNRDGRTARGLLEEKGIDSLDSFELYLWTELRGKESSRGGQADQPPAAAAIYGHRAASRDNFERRIETYLLVAALVATVTFAATFTMPGGYSQADGTAIHSHRFAFKVFVVSNTVAMSSSSVVLLCFLWAWQDPMKFKLGHLIWGHRLTFLACLAMLVSLMAAVYVTVAPTVRWPVYTVIVIGASTPVFVYLILGKEVLYVPL